MQSKGMDLQAEVLSLKRALAICETDASCS
jgi:hypothetical protein